MIKFLKNNKLEILLFFIFITIVGIVIFNAIPKKEIKNIDAKNIETAFQDIIEELKSWTGDYMIQGCSSSKDLTSWTCNVFSKEKKQVIIAIWNKNEVTLSSPVAVNDQYAELISTKPFFNDLGKVITSTEIIELAKTKGLDLEQNDAYLFIGESTINLFNNKYVWYIEERSKAEKDDDGAFILKNKYYIDALTGQFLN